MAMTIVEHSGGQYHVLLIIADGQVIPTTYIPDFFLLNDDTLRMCTSINFVLRGNYY